MARWHPGARARVRTFKQTIEAIAKHYQFNQNTRWKDLPEKVQQVFLYGSGKEEIKFRYDEGGRVYEVSRVFEGVIPNMERRYRETDSNWIREEFERYQNNRPCGTCAKATACAPKALAVKIGPSADGSRAFAARRVKWSRCRSARPTIGARPCPSI